MSIRSSQWRCSLLLASLIGFTLMTPALAQPSPPGFPSQQQEDSSRPPRPLAPRDGMPGPILEKLNLTATQKQQLQAIRQKIATEGRANREALRAAQDKMKAMLDGTASSNEIREQYRQVQVLKEKVESQRLETMLALRDVLTPTQRQQLEALSKERKRPGDRRDPNRTMPPPDAPTPGL